MSYERYPDNDWREQDAPYNQPDGRTDEEEAELRAGEDNWMNWQYLRWLEKTDPEAYRKRKETMKKYGSL